MNYLDELETFLSEETIFDIDKAIIEDASIELGQEVTPSDELDLDSIKNVMSGSVAPVVGGSQKAATIRAKEVDDRRTTKDGDLVYVYNKAKGVYIVRRRK